VQEAVLKEELRRLDRNEKRESVDMTYLKNVVLKLLETGKPLKRASENKGGLFWGGRAARPTDRSSAGSVFAFGQKCSRSEDRSLVRATFCQLLSTFR
jgi:hypothetical protein